MPSRLDLYRKIIVENQEKSPENFSFDKAEEKQLVVKTEENLDEDRELESLVFFGRIIKEEKIFDHIFTLKTVSDELKNEVYNRPSSEFQNIGKIEILEQALYKVDGYKLKKKARNWFLGNCDNNLLNRLYEKYLKLEEHRYELLKKLPEFSKKPISKIKFSVVEHLGGTITENKYKKMSEEQWMWHYLNINESKNKSMETENEQIKYLTFFINPELFKKINDQKESHEQADQAEVRDSFVSDIEKSLGDKETSKKLKEYMGDPVVKKEEIAPNPEEATMGMSGGSEEWYKD